MTPRTTTESGFDFVVVGSGGGSITAALLAKDAGLTPLIIEKQDRVGGSTGFSGGVVWIPNNPLMAREGVHDSLERARSHFDAVVSYQGPGTTPARREAFLTAGPEMIAYTESKGMLWRRPEGYADYYDDQPGGEPRSRMVEPELFDLNELAEWKDRLAVYPGFPFRIYPHELSDVMCAKRTWAGRRTVLRILRRVIAMKLRHQDIWGAGAALQGRLLQIALREGITIWPRTPFVDYVLDDGRVTGVIAERDGRRIQIAAPAGVLLNAGGFARNDRHAHGVRAQARLNSLDERQPRRHRRGDRGDDVDRRSGRLHGRSMVDPNVARPRRGLSQGRVDEGQDPAPAVHAPLRHLAAARDHR